MFTIPRVNVIESNEGYSVEVLGRTGVRCVRGQRAAFVDSEVLAGPAGLMIIAKSIVKWDDGTAIFDAERLQIVDDIRRAFGYRGFEIEVI